MLNNNAKSDDEKVILKDADYQRWCEEKNLGGKKYAYKEHGSIISHSMHDQSSVQAYKAWLCAGGLKASQATNYSTVVYEESIFILQLWSSPLRPG